MSKKVIIIENLSKQYRLGKVGRKTFQDDFNRWVHNIAGKPDPYLRIGEENHRSVKGKEDYVWALRNITLSIEEGEVLGVIGRNGAGKSTLLKILSKVTAPTTGLIKIKGRIASLLEVGTGFHPELSGRDNIFLNGAIMGMRKQEIKSRFDQIVTFAGVERYIDTPVKRYSSGMYVRLAFAVAAHLEPEILIVDEVLAVGDAEFQRKCLGKMREVSEKDGRTVLFVSHNMSAIKSLCTSVLLLKNGKAEMRGSNVEMIRKYLDSNEKIERKLTDIYSSCKRLKIGSVELLDSNRNKIDTYDFGDQIIIRFNLVFFQIFKSITLGFALNDTFNNRIFTSHSIDDKSFSEQNLYGEVSVECCIDLKWLAPGLYNFDLGVRDEDHVNVIKIKNAGTIEINVADRSKDGTGGILWYSGSWKRIK